MTEEKKNNEEINKDMNIKEEKDHKDKKHNKWWSKYWRNKT